MIHYTTCPVCGSAIISPQLEIKDYTVSYQLFFIWQCGVCTVRFTQDVPDKNEIDSYYKSDEYISHSDTKKGFINSLYHLIRKKTLNTKKKLILKETTITRGRVLDIGCGTGAFLHTMKKAGWHTTGLEPDVVARQNAKTLYDIETLEPEKLFYLKSNSYQAITMWHVLEHVHDLHAYIKQIIQLLATDGRLFIAVPNYTSYDAIAYKKYWAAYDVPRHLYHFSPKAMEILLTTYNLQLTTIKPMWFDSFYVSMLSEKYKSNRGNIFRSFWTGFISNLKCLDNKKKCSSLIYVIKKIS